MKNEKSIEHYSFIAEQNVRGFIIHFLAVNKINYIIKSGYIKQDATNIDTALLLNMIYLKYSDDYVKLTKICNNPAEGAPKTKSPGKIEKERFREFLDVFEYEEKEKAIQKLRSELIHDKESTESGLKELTKFTKNLTGTENELDIAALYHFIWQTKRKIFGKNVEWHLMPIIYSPDQGKGKSKNVERISLIVDYPEKKESNILFPFSSIVNCHQMTDERSYRNYRDSFVCFNDEFSKMKEENYSEVKKIISSSTVQYRPMRTNDTIKITQNSTFIGTCNQPINQVVFDHSGVRRFYQINAKSKMTINEAAEQRNVAENIDYTLIWKSIDENKSYEESWQSQYREQFEQSAEENRTKDDIELFMEKNNIKPGNMRVSISIMYNAFKDFIQEEGISLNCSCNKFSIRLTNKGMTKIHTNRGDMWLIDENWGPINEFGDIVETLNPEEFQLNNKLKAALSAQDYLACADIQKKLNELKKPIPNGLY